MNPGFLEFLRAAPEDRYDVFLGAARRMGTPAQNIEKDFWVCWTLDAHFNGLPEGHPRPYNADQFGPACMQRLSPGADYWLRGNGMSEDCLYLNVWLPAKTGKEKLPVLVYIFGGGFQNGDGSEPRCDGENMARHGLVAVSVKGTFRRRTLSRRNSVMERIHV
jgi:hypothetical protein